jgi:hypothetical protein
MNMKKLSKYALGHKLEQRSLTATLHFSHISAFNNNVCLFMVFNTTFKNISILSWQSVLYVEEYPEKIADHLQVTDRLYHIELY